MVNGHFVVCIQSSLDFDTVCEIGVATLSIVSASEGDEHCMICIGSSRFFSAFEVFYLY